MTNDDGDVNEQDESAAETTPMPYRKLFLFGKDMAPQEIADILNAERARQLSDQNEGERPRSEQP
jgi:hypothetical protein